MLRQNLRANSKQMYYVYWIQSGNRNYIGATVCIERRIRQHNGELAGGARRTRGRGPWSKRCVVTGFRTWTEALQFEWAFKRISRYSRKTQDRRHALDVLTCKERWTSNSPLSSEVPLDIQDFEDTMCVTRHD